MMKNDSSRQRKSTANYGANTPPGSLNTLSKTMWWELKGIVMNSVKEVLIDCLSPKHHDQWEFAARKCFQLGCKKMAKNKKMDNDMPQDGSKHIEVLRRVARLYISSKQDGVPREQLHAICSVVNTTVSMDEWNEVLKEVQREMAAEKALMAQPGGTEMTDTHDSNSPSNVNSHHPLSVATSSSSTATNTLDQSEQGQGVDVNMSVLSSPPQLPPANVKSDQQPQHSSPSQIRISWRAWQLAKEKSVADKASASRQQDREYERRCKSYDSNKAICTAIRLVEEDNRRQQQLVEDAATTSSKSGALDPLSQVIQNRLGYQSATIFADKLDIMQKIIRAYREAENTDEKDFLLGLISGSFTRDEVNKIIVPPEAQVMLPGRVRNTALISGHKWTFIRRAAGCQNMNAKLDPERYSEGVKKRKRTIEERRYIATTRVGSSDMRSGPHENTAGAVIMGVTQSTSI